MVRPLAGRVARARALLARRERRIGCWVGWFMGLGKVYLLF